MSISVMCQTEPAQNNSIKTQCKLKPKIKGIGIQCQKSSTRDFGIQCNMATTKDVHIQCNILNDNYILNAEEALFGLSSCENEHIFEDVPPRSSTPCPSKQNSSSSYPSGEGSFIDDPSYCPNDSSFEEEESSFDSLQSQKHKAVREQKTFIVYEENLFEIFHQCPECQCEAQLKSSTRGTMITIEQECCRCEFRCKWCSQPLLKSTPAGNVILSASILFAGTSATKVLRVLKFLNCASISYGTYLHHQRNYLMPAVNDVWIKEVNENFKTLENQNSTLVAGVDSRCDFPGHSAKFCSSTIMDMKNHKILCIQLVQSNEVSSSNGMELGLIRDLTLMDQRNIGVSSLVSDRHVQIRAYLKRNRPDIIHLFDVWHIAKGLKKKLHSLAQQKGCEVVGLWNKSIINHVYHCASIIDEPTSADVLAANQQVIEGRWRSLLLHITNKHDGYGDSVPPCIHPPLQGEQRNKEWIDPNSKAFEKLEGILCNKRIIDDIKMLSPFHQTSSLEAFTVW